MAVVVVAGLLHCHHRLVAIGDGLQSTKEYAGIDTAGGIALVDGVVRLFEHLHGRCAHHNTLCISESLGRFIGREGIAQTLDKMLKGCRCNAHLLHCQRHIACNHHAHGKCHGILFVGKICLCVGHTADSTCIFNSNLLFVARYETETNKQIECQCCNNCQKSGFPGFHH